jgi:hypothetical protein
MSAVLLGLVGAALLGPWGWPAGTGGYGPK